MKKKHYSQLFFIISICFLILLIIGLFIEPAIARPGGGHSFSGGSSRSSGSGGGGDGIGGLIIYLILQLPPQVSIPLIIIFLVLRYGGKHFFKRFRNEEVDSGPTVTNRQNMAQGVEHKIASLKQIDPYFSRVVFYDFVGSLYNKFYSLRGTDDFEKLTPFFAKKVFEKAQKRGRQLKEKVSEIVIGNIRIKNVNLTRQDIDIIEIEISANYTLTIENKSTRYIVDEAWMLTRQKGVMSQEPEKMRTVSCPNCGAPVNFNDAGYCQFCNTFVESGKMQWMVAMKNVLRLETLKTQDLTTYSQEVGTSSPTVVQPTINQNMAAFAQNNHLNWDEFWNKFRSKIAKPIFMEIYEAWSQNRWSDVRHLVSDRLYESYNFWIEAYIRHRLFNRLDNIQIGRIELARIDLDKYYESITVRIFASCHDYIENMSGKVVGGSKRKKRDFSEYWTFIRRTGVNKSPDDFNMKTCPNCGAPADKMGQAAECGYCGAKVSNGDFSWVLSLIVQDEVYTG